LLFGSACNGVTVMPRLAIATCACVLAAVVPLAGAADAPRPRTPRLETGEIAARERMLGNDPVGLLLLSGLAEEKAAQRLRQKVFLLLKEQRETATQAELDALASRLARSLPEATRSPVEVKEILGAPTQVSRQVLYRRYLEQWIYDSPVPLCAVFDCLKGQDPSLRADHPVISPRR
jgi:hypothetical protein